MGRYVALLRGINVGGKNLVRMPDLRRCFEELGYGDVSTHIQSGNVLFRTSEPQARLVAGIEAALRRRFGYDATVVVRSQKQLRDIVEHAPEGFGTRPAEYHYDVIFLMPPLAAAAALRQVPRREGVDEAHAGPGVLYFSRLSARKSQSRLSRIVALPLYAQLTIRNWNTTTALLRLLESAPAR